MAVRQDAWTPEDDLTLAEVTLRHIREGSTQLSAFEEVGEKLGRTPAACGFRWNSTVRKKYDAAIQIAKAQRQSRLAMRKAQQKAEAEAARAGLSGFESGASVKSEGPTEDSLSFDAIIRYLRQWKGVQSELKKQVKALEKELRDKEEEIAKLKEENERLEEEVKKYQTDYQTVNDDYKALIQIMDRARKMALLTEEGEEQRAKFKMDENGNLERIE